MKRKGLIFAVLLAITVLAVTACTKSGDGGQDPAGAGSTAQNQTNDNSASNAGSDSSNASSDTQNAASEEKFEMKGYIFDANGTKLAVDMPMSKALESLPEAASYFEATSCAFEGLDKTYTYPHFEIVTYPKGDKDYISTIYLFDDILSTPEGIYIGSSKADMEAAYGTDYKQNGEEYIYTKDGMELRIILKAGSIISITYASSATRIN
ncbi:MAG: hypothetical protein K6E62_02600 [Lachnospiraceae bacterium]|nr:hypothetical protein [Lachnospiraceae bacterium]